jgi:hypothetical protein
VPKKDLPRFYREQLFANEVMLLPYYTIADPVLPSVQYDGWCSLCPRAHGERHPSSHEGGTDPSCGPRLQVARTDAPLRVPASRHGGLHLHDRKPLGHQRGQLVPMIAQAIQHLGHRRLHPLERHVPAAQRLLPEGLPQPLDQVQVR